MRHFGMFRIFEPAMDGRFKTLSSRKFGGSKRWRHMDVPPSGPDNDAWPHRNVEQIVRNPYYPVGLNLAGRNCVVIGNDREADEKSAALRECDADVRRIEDPAGLRDDDVSGAFLVISTPQDEALSARLRALADRERFLLCCIDQPKHGFVAMLAIAKAGPVRVAISTAGLAPRIGKLIKEGLQRAMDGRFARFAEQIAARREDVRAKHPAAEDSSVRRNAIIEAAHGFEADVSFRYPGWFEEQ